MSIAVLLIVTSKWKQLTFPSTDKCINKMWYICAMKLLFGNLKNEI